MSQAESLETSFGPRWISKISLAIAIVSLSLAAIFIKLGEQEISPNALVFHRLWISAIVFGIWNQLTLTQSNSRSPNIVSQKYSISQSNIEVSIQENYIFWLLLGLGTCSCLALYCSAWSLTQAGAANSTLLKNFTSIFTILIGWLFFNKRFDQKLLLGVLIAVFGAVFMSFSDWQAASNTLWGDILALLCSFLYSISLLIVEQLRKHLNMTTIMQWSCSVGVVLTLPILCLRIGNIFPYSMKGWIAVIAFAMICQVVGQGLLTYCLKQLSAGLISVSLLLEPLIAALLAWLILAENLTPLDGIAFILILTGIYLANSASTTQKS